MLKNALLGSVSVRLFGLVVLAALGLLTLMAFTAMNLRDVYVEQSIQKTKNLAEVARDLVKAYDVQHKAGKFDLATAQTLARTAMRDVRYQEREYYFVVTLDGTTLVSPANPQGEGRNSIGAKDANGFEFIADLLKKARNGGGHTFYWFARPGQTEPAPKVSYAVLYPGWNWVIGTGVYIDDIDKLVLAKTYRVGAIGLIILAIVSILAALIARSVKNPLLALARATSRLGAGEYAIDVPETKRLDEIGSLAQAIDSLRTEAVAAQDLRVREESLKQAAETEKRQAMLALANTFEKSLKAVVGGISEVVERNGSASARMSGVSQEAQVHVTGVSKAAEDVDTSIQTVASAAEQLYASIAEISSRVRNSTDISARAVEKAVQTDSLVQGLSSAVDRISAVVSLINDIASQTNLLALNATIEAARAGEMGKGFAVVANEVKVLANQTAKATSEIGEQIEAVRTATAQAVEAVRDIATVIGELSDVSATISVSIDEQSVATRQISGNVNQAASGTRQATELARKLAGVTRQVGESAGVVSECSNALSASSRELYVEVDKFLGQVRG